MLGVDEPTYGDSETLVTVQSLFPSNNRKKRKKKIKPREFYCAGKGEFKNLHQRTRYVINIFFVFNAALTEINGSNSFAKRSCGSGSFTKKEKKKTDNFHFWTLLKVTERE